MKVWAVDAKRFIYKSLLLNKLENKISNLVGLEYKKCLNMNQ